MLKAVCNYQHSTQGGPNVLCNRKVLFKEKVWRFQGRVWLQPAPGADKQEVILLRFTTPEPVFYREAMMLCIELMDEAIRSVDCADYAWRMDIVTG